MDLLDELEVINHQLAILEAKYGKNLKDQTTNLPLSSWMEVVHRDRFGKNWRKHPVFLMEQSKEHVPQEVLHLLKQYQGITPPWLVVLNQNPQASS